jgi:flagellar motor switch protein FliM
MADEPENLAGASEEGMGVPPGWTEAELGERILNQDEIDSLLGFDLSDDDQVERSGIRSIINSALVSYERLPMLEIVFDRLVRLMTTSLRNFTSDNVEVSLDNISSVRFGDYLNSIPLPAILAVFRAE